MSDTVILGLITAAGSAFAVFMSYKVAQLQRVARATHEAVNSLSLVLARRLADVSQRLADAQPTESNIEAAKDARKAVEQSQEVQAELGRGRAAG
jgi:hypothetical protein